MPWQAESLALSSGLPVTRCSGHSAGEDVLALTEKNLPIILKSSPIALGVGTPCEISHLRNP